jgi:ATP-dependent phosphofructokinase / diphosphate-dependent phosphofructokinase
VRAGVNRHGHQIIGFRYGWAGVLEANTVELTAQNTAGILHRGGTILGTSRTNPYKDGADGTALVREVLEREGIDGLIPIGGEDTLGVAGRLSADGVPVVGVPKTIDNDLAGTDVTFGFHTAVQIATDAIDRLHTTAESHDRVLLVEVMGRHAGWIATYAGIAGGATVILVPELPFDIDEVCGILQRRHRRGRYASIVVVAEGAEPAEGTLVVPPRPIDQFGHAKLAGIAHLIAPAIEERTGFDTRVVELGHVQRGGTPNAYDRVLATRYGLAAIDAVHDKAWGEMVVYREMRIERAPLRLALGRTRTLDLAMYEDVAAIFFG